VWGVGGMNKGETQITRRKTWASATLVTINPSSTDQRKKPELRVGRPAAP